MNLPEYILDLSENRIVLKQENTANSWKILGNFAVETDGLQHKLANLRKQITENSSNNFPIQVWLPPSEIIITDLELTDASDEDMREEAREEISKKTRYSSEELVVDLSAQKYGDITRVAAVSQKSLSEAYDFTTENGFNPVVFRGPADGTAFPGQPTFFYARKKNRSWLPLAAAAVFAVALPIAALQYFGNSDDVAQNDPISVEITEVQTEMPVVEIPTVTEEAPNETVTNAAEPVEDTSVATSPSINTENSESTNIEANTEIAKIETEPRKPTLAEQIEALKAEENKPTISEDGPKATVQDANGRVVTTAKAPVVLAPAKTFRPLSNPFIKVAAAVTSQQTEETIDTSATENLVPDKNVASSNRPISRPDNGTKTQVSVPETSKAEGQTSVTTDADNKAETETPNTTETAATTSSQSIQPKARSFKVATTSTVTPNATENVAKNTEGITASEPTDDVDAAAQEIMKSVQDATQTPAQNGSAETSPPIQAPPRPAIRQQSFNDGAVSIFAAALFDSDLIITVSSKSTNKQPKPRALAGSTTTKTAPETPTVTPSKTVTASGTSTSKRPKTRSISNTKTTTSSENTITTNSSQKLGLLSDAPRKRPSSVFTSGRITKPKTPKAVKKPKSVPVQKPKAPVVKNPAPVIKKPVPVVKVPVPVVKKPARVVKKPKPVTKPTPSAQPKTTDTNTGRIGRMKSATLIGIFGGSNNRRAMIKPKRGGIVEVHVGDKLQGYQVIAINDDHVILQKRRRRAILRMPK